MYVSSQEHDGNKNIDCLQPLFLRTQRKKRGQSTRRRWGGVGFASEASKKNLVPLPLPSQAFRFAMASSSRDSIRVFNDRIKIRENTGL